jgi:hypothetical protein
MLMGTVRQLAGLDLTRENEIAQPCSCTPIVSIFLKKYGQ